MPPFQLHHPAKLSSPVATSVNVHLPVPRGRLLSLPSFLHVSPVSHSPPHPFSSFPPPLSLYPNSVPLLLTTTTPSTPSSPTPTPQQPLLSLSIRPALAGCSESRPGHPAGKLGVGSCLESQCPQPCPPPTLASPPLLLPLLPDHWLPSLPQKGANHPLPLLGHPLPQLWLPVEFTARRKECWADSPETPSWPVPLSGPQFAHL